MVAANRTAEPAAYDFRRTVWGMSFDEVKAIEDSDAALGSRDVLMYDRMLGGVPCTVHYEFVGGRLTQGTYALWGDPTPRTIEDFDSLAQLLIEKYGQPASRFDDRYDTSLAAAGLGASWCKWEWCTRGTLVEIVFTNHTVLIWYKPKLDGTTELDGKAAHPDRRALNDL